MTRLESSWELTQKVSELKEGKLKDIINQWIDKNECSGKDKQWSNIIYRSSLSYILDNISKHNLIDEICNHINNSG